MVRLRAGARTRSATGGASRPIKRIGGPWYYYVPELVLYEPLITFPALAAIIGAVLARSPRRTASCASASSGALGMLFIYAWAQEKVPWLLIPQLAAADDPARRRWFRRVIESRASSRRPARRSRRRRSAR